MRFVSDGAYRMSLSLTGLGRLEIGDISLVVAIASPHRKAAFEASAYAIDRIKQIVPIWKKEFFEGGEVWVGSQEDECAKAAV